MWVTEPSEPSPGRHCHKNIPWPHPLLYLSLPCRQLQVLRGRMMVLPAFKLSISTQRYLPSSRVTTSSLRPVLQALLSNDYHRSRTSTSSPTNGFSARKSSPRRSKGETWLQGAECEAVVSESDINSDCLDLYDF